jgi:Cytochrome oxidase complex assembly protein 1
LGAANILRLGTEAILRRLLIVISILIPVVAVGLVFLRIAKYSRQTDSRIDSFVSQEVTAFELSSTAHALLGESLRAEGPEARNLHEVDDHGISQINVPVAGSKGKGTLFISATEKGGVWQADHLDLKPAGQDLWWDLLHPGQTMK